MDDLTQIRTEIQHTVIDPKRLRSAADNHNELKQRLKVNTYYLLVFVISFIALFILPFLGSSLGLKFEVPNTVGGWTVYIITRILGAVINILLFHSFVSQAKVNSLGNENYKKAIEILFDPVNGEIEKELSPAEYLRKEYKIKGVTMGITSLIMLIGLSSAIMSFSWVMFFSYVITVVLGVVFGVIEMLTVEDYWCNRYLIYAYQQRADRQSRRTPDTVGIIADDKHYAETQETPCEPNVAVIRRLETDSNGNKEVELNLINQYRPKSIWWKRYDKTDKIGRRTIYTVSDTKGFEVRGFPQAFQPVVLVGGVLPNSVEHIDYIPIGTQSLRLNAKFYEYDTESEQLIEYDIADADTVINAVTSTIQIIDGNKYVKMHAFDCKVELDDQVKDQQPIRGLLFGERNMTMMLYNIKEKNGIPQSGDLMQFRGQFFTIGGVSRNRYYTPKEHTYLRIMLNGINK
jgi:hypothetical protein